MGFVLFCVNHMRQSQTNTMQIRINTVGLKQLKTGNYYNYIDIGILAKIFKDRELSTMNK